MTKSLGVSLLTSMNKTNSNKKLVRETRICFSKALLLFYKL